MKIFDHSEVADEMIILKANAWQAAQKKTFANSPSTDTFFLAAHRGQNITQIFSNLRVSTF